jgi:hypothetical protein
MAKLVRNCLVLEIGREEEVVLRGHIFHDGHGKSIDQHVNAVDEDGELFIALNCHQLPQFMGQNHQKGDFVTLLDEEGEVFVNDGLVDCAEVGVTEELLRSLKEGIQFDQLFLRTDRDCL